MKKFFTFISRQIPERFLPKEYQAINNSKLTYPQTRFPLIPVLNGYTKKGETAQVIVFCEDYSNSEHNLTFLEQELDKLQAEKGIILERIVEKIPLDDGYDAQLDTFAKMLNHIDDGDEVYACITYGSKPTPIVQTMAFRYARFAGKNTAIRCVVYGHVDFNTNEAKIYDLTGLLIVDDALRLLAEVKALKENAGESSDDKAGNAFDIRDALKKMISL